MANIKRAALIGCFLILIPSAKNISAETFPTFTSIEESVIKSTVLGENRKILVSLPTKYIERDYKYPVIYVLDGEFLFESVRSTTNVMALRNHMPESIIVGVLNPNREKRFEQDISRHGGKPQKYVEFLKHELIPYIEKHYRAGSHRTIIGLSPSNGVLFESILSSPGLFRNHMALAVGIAWPIFESESLIDTIMNKINKPDYPKIQLYMGIADSDLPVNSAEFESFSTAQSRLKQSRVEGERVKLDSITDTEHYDMVITGLYRAFKHFYPREDWKNLRIFLKQKSPAKSIENHYKKLSIEYELDARPLEIGYDRGSSMLGTAYNLARWKAVEEAISVLMLTLSYYPNSANASQQLSKLYAQRSMNKKTTL